MVFLQKNPAAQYEMKPTPFAPLPITNVQEFFPSHPEYWCWNINVEADGDGGARRQGAFAQTAEGSKGSKWHHLVFLILVYFCEYTSVDWRPRAL
jgi:hypothetical protein